MVSLPLTAIYLAFFDSLVKKNNLIRTGNGGIALASHANFPGNFPCKRSIDAISISHPLRASKCP